MYAYFCLRAYPDCGVSLLLTDPLMGKYRKMLGSIEGDIRIHEDFGKGYPVGNTQILKALRWVVGEEYSEGHENLYVGDVDLLVCREALTLEDAHLHHCQQTDLPYSNAVRLKKGTSPRLSGLHFAIRKSYYEKVGPLLDGYRKRLENGDIGYENNEMMLYELVRKAGIPPNTTDWFRPHHGLHLGLWRERERDRDSGLSWAHGGKQGYKDSFGWFMDIEKEDQFQWLINHQPLIEIERMKRAMSKEL